MIHSLTGARVDGDTVAHVLVMARSEDLPEVAELLAASGHAVTLIPVTPDRRDVFDAPLLFPALQDQLRGGSRDVIELLAADAPARAPLTFHGSPPADPDERSSGREVRYKAGDRATAQPGRPVEILKGAVALTAVHADGAEVLISVLGPGDFLLHHPSDVCRIEAVAQTAVQAESFAEDDLLGQPRYAAALASRALRAQAWAASQAHPYIEQRLLGILNLLSEQFGVPHEGGRLIDVRLTHSQLAAITGTTRPTVTRVIAALTKTGHLAVVGSGATRRLCVFSGGL